MRTFIFNRVHGLVSYLLFILCSIFSLSSQANGQLDLSQQDFSQHQIYTLDTQWRLAWDDFYSPNGIPKDTQAFDFPSTWNNLTRPDGSTSPYGYATLYLELILPKDLPGIYLKLSDLPSAGKLWANGLPVIEQGVPGKDKTSEQPGFGPETVYIHSLHSQESSSAEKKQPTTSTDNRILLALHTSNFHYKEGGAWSSIQITGESGFNQLSSFPAVTDSALTILLLVLGGLFLSLYFARTQEKAALFFSCFCTVVGLRNGITGEHVLNQLFPVISWVFSQKLEHILLFITSPLFIAFTHRLYPRYRSAKVEKVFASISLLFSVFVAVTPTTLVTQTSIPYQIIIIISLVYLLRIAALALLHKRKSAHLYAASFLLLTSLVLIDVLTHNMIIQLPLMSEWGISLFVIMHAWLLNQRYAFSLTNEEALSDRLKKQNAALQQLDSIKDDFLAQTSHELRTPIHGISSLSEMVLNKETDLSKESATNLQLIHSSSIRLANLVNDILDLSSIKHQHLKLSLSSISLVPILEQVTLSLRPLLKGRPVTMTIHCPEWIPKVMADENRLQQILFNLIGNAVKFTPEGNIDIYVEMLNKDKIKVSVKDTGLGIDHSETGEIFDAYKQGTQEGLSASGHGLGLTITRDLLKMHQSKLHVKSIPGHGSTFYFELDTVTHIPHTVHEITQPISDPEVSSKERRQYQRPEITSRTERVAATTNQYPLMVWAVDDEPVNLQIIEHQLHGFGYQCRCFNSAQLMLDAFEQEEQPDILLLDVMMPGINGMEACQLVRRDYNSLELPIIMLTARQQTQDIVQAFEAGASDYLAKPYNQAELKVRLEAQLQASLCHELSQSNEALLDEIETKEHLEKQLAHRNRLLLNAFDTSNTAFIVFDHDFQVEYQNLAMAKLLIEHNTYFTDKNAQPIADIIQQNQDNFTTGDRWAHQLDDLSLNLTVHKFNHQNQNSFSVVIETPETESSQHKEISERVKLLEEIVSKLPIASISNEPDTAQDSSLTFDAEQPIEVSEQNEVSAQSTTGTLSDSESREYLIEATRLSLRLWEKHTGKSKAELAEDSKIWRVYIDGGTIKTRTLDKYLSEKTLPKRPRWRSVIKTMDFIIHQCPLEASEIERLEELTNIIEQDQLSR